MSSSTCEVRVKLELLRGHEAICALERSGLLDREEPLPLLPFDIKLVLESPSGFAIVGYAENVPIGYVVASLHWPGGGEKHLYLWQAVHIGHPEWSRRASDYLDSLAADLRCDAISMTVPMRLQHLMRRCYGYTPTGIYLVKRVGRVQ